MKERFNKVEERRLNNIFCSLVEKCKIKDCEMGWINNKPCECRKAFIFLKELVYSKIPTDYWLVNLKKMSIKPMVSKIMVLKYIENFENAKEKGLGICFSGSNGVGKTSMLVEIGKKAVSLNLKTSYMTTQDFINYKMINDYAELEKIENCDVLLLDELDKVYIKKNSDYVVAQLENLLRLLIPKNVIVCFATNWTFDEISKNLGDSVFSIAGRKIKMLSIIGEDYSKKLQDKWEESLDSEPESFLTKEIIELSNDLGRWRKNNEC